jgi:hypothetical protein
MTKLIDTPQYMITLQQNNQIRNNTANGEWDEEG